MVTLLTNTTATSKIAVNHKRYSLNRDIIGLIAGSKWETFLLQTDEIEFPKTEQVPFLDWVDEQKEVIGKAFFNSVTTVQDCHEQNSQGWHDIRAKFFSSSTHFISNTGEKTPTEYRKCLTLAVNRFILDLAKDDPLYIAHMATQKEQYSTQMMVRGHMMEEEGKRLYAEQTGYSIQEVGFANIKGLLLGSSVDFLENDDKVGEIKSPDLVGYLDPYYWEQHNVQCQIHMLVHKRKNCTFIKYFPHMPLDIKNIPVDYLFMYNLKESLERLTKNVNTEYERLLDLYYS
jgi:hypothetical protein